MAIIDDLKNKITNADCIDILKQLPDKSIDLVFTDPPYGIGMSKNAGLSDKYTEKDWDKQRPPKYVFDEILRVSKEQIIFGGNYFTDYLPPASCAVWDKRCGIIPERTFADGELLYVSYKVPLRIFRFLWDGMLQENMKNKEVKFHPTQKPVELCERILRYYTKKEIHTQNDGFLVADFFGGSGTTAIACHNLGLDFVCIEKDVEYYKKSVARLNDVQAQLNMFHSYMGGGQ
jgi:site-specific DNA-methyltransferase (adenine-specific)